MQKLLCLSVERGPLEVTYSEPILRYACVDAPKTEPCEHTISVMSSLGCYLSAVGSGAGCNVHDAPMKPPTLDMHASY
jgi:hypothetical protein